MTSSAPGGSRRHAVRSGSTRRWALPLLVLALVSSACTVRFNTDVELSGDDTATVNLVAGVRFEGGVPEGADQGFDEMDPAQTQNDIQAEADRCGFSPDAVAVSEYTQDEFQGVEIVMTDIPIAAVGCFLAEGTDAPFDRFSIVRDGGNYVFNGEIGGLLDLAGGAGLGGQKTRGDRQVATESGDFEIPPEALQELEDAAQQAEEAFSELEQQLGEQLPSELDQLGDEFGQGFEDALGGAAAPEIEARVSITFPGSVSEHNGTLEGNTVTWDLAGDQPTVMMAVGSAGGGAGNLLFIIIGAVVLLLLILGLVLFLRSRGKKNAPEPYMVPGAPGAPGGGFGGPPGPQQPAGGFGGPPGQPQAPAGFGGPPGGGQPPQQPGGFGGPPGQPQQQPQQPGGFGGPPGQPQQPPQQPAGFGGPPGGGQPPQPQGPPQPQAPQAQEPYPPVPDAGQQPPQGQPPQDGGFDPGSTRTFRPEDLLPPEDSGK